MREVDGVRGFMAFRTLNLPTQNYAGYLARGGLFEICSDSMYSCEPNELTHPHLQVILGIGSTALNQGKGLVLGMVPDYFALLLSNSPALCGYLKDNPGPSSPITFFDGFNISEQGRLSCKIPQMGTVSFIANRQLWNWHWPGSQWEGAHFRSGPGKGGDEGNDNSFSWCLSHFNKISLMVGQ